LRARAVRSAALGFLKKTTIPNAQPTFYANITVAGGPAPARAYMHELMPDVLEGRIEPGLVFDHTTNIDGVPDGSRAMNERDAIKVMIEF
jgi:threonine dehydrogenase-like Zn-dependent dehydrogenase